MFTLPAKILRGMGVAGWGAWGGWVTWVAVDTELPTHAPQNIVTGL